MSININFVYVGQSLKKTILHYLSNGCDKYIFAIEITKGENIFIAAVHFEKIKADKIVNSNLDHNHLVEVNLCWCPQ